MKKEDKKLVFVFVTLVIIILSIFAVAIEYRIRGITEVEKEKLPLLVQILADETAGAVPFVANFTSLVLYYQGNVKYHWDFGDNETSDEISPVHIYNKSGLYNCTLTITDSSGEKTSDTVKISVRGNQAPSCSIFTDLSPSRPYIFILTKFSKKIIYRQLLDAGSIPPSLFSIKNFIFCSAEASDPEGDEIVSYEWELKPPMYKTKLGKQVKPSFKFKGKDIEIPVIYVYMKATYDLTLTVTDSKGNKGSSTVKIEVKESSIEALKDTLKGYIYGFQRNLWLPILKDIFGKDVGNLINEKIFSKLPNLPVLKLLIAFKLFKDWGISPVATSEIIQFLEKHPALQNIVRKNLERIISFLEKRNPDSPLIDIIEKILERLDMANKRPVLSNEIPADKTKYLSVDYPEVAITVKDPEGDPFNISIHGLYVNNISLINQHNNTFVATLKTPLPNLTDIYWHVNVSYSQNKWINATYKFSTW